MHFIAKLKCILCLIAYFKAENSKIWKYMEDLSSPQAEPGQLAEIANFHVYKPKQDIPVQIS